MINSIVCPISVEKIDSNVSRLTIFLNVVLMALFITTRNPIFIAAVAIDYLIRAAFRVEYSPIRFLALKISHLARLKSKPIGLAQKVFASRLGLLCAVAAVILLLTDYTVASLVVASFLMTLSILDSVFNLCVGCLIYNYLVYPFYKGK